MPLLLADASPIIAFCNGGEHRLLANVTRLAVGRIEVPHFVDNEIHQKCNRVGAENYLALKAQGAIHVYDEPMFNGPDEDVLSHVLDLLDLEDGDFHARVKDGGEAFAVAYAARHKRNGTDPRILMDDRQGRDWARFEGVQVHRTIWVFEEAKRRRIVTTAHAMTTSYEAVCRHTRALNDLSNEPQLLSGLP